MSVDLTVLVRHKFYELGDRQKSIDFCNQTIELLKRNIKFDLPPNLRICDDGSEFVEYIINIGERNCQLTLRRGYWQLEPFTRYSAYFYKYIFNTEELVRSLVKEITYALGERDIWLCEEYHSWNCSKFDIDKGTFEQWLRYAQKVGIREYSTEQFTYDEDNQLIYHTIYHDDFANLEQADVSEWYDKMRADYKKEVEEYGVE